MQEVLARGEGDRWRGGTLEEGNGALNARWIRAWLVMTGLLVTMGPGARADYIVTDLGALPKGSSSQGMAISSTGKVAGSGDVGTLASHAFITNPVTGKLDDLGTLVSGQSSFGEAINSGGTVVGNAGVGGGHSHAFKAAGPGSMQDLGLLTGWTDSFATGINTSGQIAGYGVLAGGVTHAFETNTQGIMTEVAALNGLVSQANGINDKGNLVGSFVTSTGHTHAFRTEGSGLVQDLGGLPGGSDTSSGVAINLSGEVVGFGGFPGSFHAFRTLGDGSLQDLKTLSGATTSIALAVNDSGQIVGNSSSASGLSHAFLFSDATQMIDLNSFLVNGAGWTLNTATGINNLGQITGTGVINGVQHAFRLTPTIVPEPSALVLTGLGLMGVLGYRLTRG
jgi:probable HAF family extracellular repeat protein